MRHPLRSKRTLAGLAAAALVTGGCAIDASTRTATGRFERSFTVDGPVDLDIHTRSGEIDVKVGATNTVRVVGRIHASDSVIALGAGYTPEQQVKALVADPPARQWKNAIRIGDHDGLFFSGNVSISYEVTVPPDTRVNASSRSGSQTIESIRGPVNATSRSGSIRVGHVARDVEIATRLGEVDVRLPAEGGARLDVETRSGNIDADGSGVRDRDHRRRRHLSTTIGQGDRSVEVTTRSGSIRIRNSGAVSAEAPDPSTPAGR